MGMIGRYLQVTPDQLAAVKAHPDSVIELFHPGISRFLPPPAAATPVPWPGLLFLGGVILLVVAYTRDDSRTRRFSGVGILLILVALLTGLPSRHGEPPRPPTRPPAIARNPDVLRVDKAWQGIHFLLTGQVEGGDPPLANVVLGGHEIGEDLGYGAARYLSPAEVKAVADALVPITSKTLRARFDPEAFREAEIYTFNDEDAADPGYYLGYFEKIKAYYRAAAAKGNGMLLIID